MVKKTTKGESNKMPTERGITPGKVAYLYGVSLETFNKWIKDESESIDELAQDDELHFYQSRKWAPKHLEILFNVFGDPRPYQDIINNNSDE